MKISNRQDNTGFFGTRIVSVRHDNTGFFGMLASGRHFGVRLIAAALVFSVLLACLPAQNSAIVHAEETSESFLSAFSDSGLYRTVFYTDSKPALESLTASFPAAMPAVTASGDEVEVPVTWGAVGDDYETSSSRYFQFAPTPSEGYELPADYDAVLQAPYIAVFVNVGVDAPVGTDEETVSDQDMSGADASDIFEAPADITEDAYDEAVFEDSSSVVKGENAATCFKFFTNEMLLSSAAACGIMANIMAESSFRPDALGDNGTSYGICQWHNSRWDKLKAYCKDNGLKWKTLEGQLNYLKYEAEKDYPRTMARMRGVSNDADGAWDAGDCWCRNFEVPANKEKMGQIRGNLAKNTFWPAYGIVAVEGTDITVMAGRKMKIADLCFGGLDIKADKYKIAGKYQKYATISKTGKITAKKKGKVVVEAQQAFTNSEGVTAYVTVAKAKVSVIKKPKLTIPKMTDLSKQTDVFECFDIDLCGITPDKIKSSKTSVITVSEDGKLTALKNGKSKITVYFGTPGKSGTVAVSTTVKVKVPET